MRIAVPDVCRFQRTEVLSRVSLEIDRISMFLSVYFKIFPNWIKCSRMMGTPCTSCGDCNNVNDPCSYRIATTFY